MSQQTRLTLVLGLNMVMIAGLLIVGRTSHSLGVLAAGGDFAADSIAILLGIMAIQIAKHPDGHPKPPRSWQESMGSSCSSSPASFWLAGRDG